jgi:MFS family permease
MSSSVWAILIFGSFLLGLFVLLPYYTLGEDINPWGVAMFQTLQGVGLSSPQEEAAYGKWLDQTSTREEARQDRIHGAAGVMPSPLWIALFAISAIVLAFLLGFADKGDRAWVQAMFMGSVVAVIVILLMLLRFLDNPFHGGVGAVQPVAMERTELLIDQQLAAKNLRRLCFPEIFAR